MRILRLFLFSITFVTVFFIVHQDAAQANNTQSLKIYHDSDWSNNVESSEAIWRGMTLALNEVGHEINGVEIELVKKNHSGNVTRSLGNMQDFLKDPLAIAVFSGMHSPPLIMNRAFINENGIPVMVPWAAGGPITRYPSEDNSVFRLSLDDTKAGAAMVDFAAEKHGCTMPYLLLENTPWGDSNAKNIKAALAEKGKSANGMQRLNWGLKSYRAHNIVQDIIDEKADCIILVSNVAEGSQIALAMADIELENRIPIISHWGITGGNFHNLVDAETRRAVDISFLQTCFSFLNAPLSPKAERVFSELKTRYPDDIKTAEDIRSPVGLIHGYDLMKITISALENIDLNSETIGLARQALRAAMETVEGPVNGLVKTYRKPFSKFEISNPDAHEALGRENICLAKYGDNNEIIVEN